MSGISAGQAERRDEVLERWERSGIIERGCKGCQDFYDAKDPYCVFAPRHTASVRCESGKKPHCTCAICF